MRRLLWWLLSWATAHAAPANTTRSRLSVLPKAWLFGSANDRLKKKRVALLMAGNVRTHDSCAPSIRKHLLEHKYNDRWRFEIVALAYKERFGKAIHKDAVSKTWTQGEASQRFAHDVVLAMRAGVPYALLGERLLADHRVFQPRQWTTAELQASGAALQRSFRQQLAAGIGGAEVEMDDASQDRAHAFGEASKILRSADEEGEEAYGEDEFEDDEENDGTRAGVVVG